MKECSRCGISKPLDDFARTSKVRGNRVTSTCKSCVVERVLAWRSANPGKAKANAARHREKHKADRNAKALARYYRLMVEDPEAVRARRRAQAKTPQGVTANRAARHARRGAKPTPEAVEYMQIIATDPCSYCGTPGVETDHITPIAQGGDGDWLNLTASCRRCNAQKNDRSLLQYLMEGTAVNA